MARLFITFIITGLVCVLGIAQDPEVIKLSGNFAVSDAGSATYSIPITLPPGVGGMKPDLSLNYNSNGGNGILGIGWAFSGMSVIARGNRTIEQDGVTYGIQFNTDDVYYLDGERLVQWNELFPYGADGSTYGTESNTFIKVVSYGTSGQGPAYFEAYTKTGLKLTFGSNNASRVFVPGSQTVLYYLLNRIEENRVSGNTNYMTFEYEKDENNAMYRPSRIRYTHNQELLGSNTSLTDVLFLYVDRNDKDVGYINGIRSSITKRLGALQIVQNNVVKEHYFFDYTEYGDNNTSLLERISHCVTGTLVTDCSSDTLSFVWDIPNTQLSFQAASNPIPASAIQGSNKKIQAQDLNNDGLTDIIITNHSTTLTFQIYLNRGAGNFSLISSNLQSTFPTAAVNFVDVNSDGFIDVVLTDVNGTNIWYINDKSISLQGANFIVATPQIIQADLQGPATTKQFFFIDYNGDARSDFLILNVSTGSVILYENESDSTHLVKFTKRTGINFGLSSSDLIQYYIEFVDLDNDGKTDVMMHRKLNKETNGHNKWYKNVYNPYNSSTPVWTFSGENLIPTAYFKTEAISHAGFGYNSNHTSGNGFRYFKQVENICQYTGRPVYPDVGFPKFNDINGDGLVDIIINHYHSHTWFNSGNAGGHYQFKTIHAFINRGNYSFELMNDKTSEDAATTLNLGAEGFRLQAFNNDNHNISCAPNNCSASLCFEGFYYDEIRNSGGISCGTSWNKANGDVRNIPNTYKSFFVDINGDNKVDVIENFVTKNGNTRDLYFNTSFNKNELFCNSLRKSNIPTNTLNDQTQLAFGRFNRFGTDIFLYNTATGQNILQKNNADGRPPVIIIFNGQLGGSVSVEYSTMNDNDVYVKGTNRSYPDIDYSSSARIVKGYSKATSSSFPNFVTNIQYKYHEGVLNLTGRGFRGFKKIETTDNVQGFKVVKEFEEDSKFIASNLKSQKTYSRNGILLSEELYKNVTWISNSDGSGGIFLTLQDKIFTPFPSESIARTYDLSGNLLTENKSRMYMDVFGNVQYQVFEHGDGCIDSIYNVFSNTFDTWFIGRLTRSTVYKQCNGGTEMVRESEFEYHPVTGYLVRETLEPNQNEQLRTVKTYARDNFGNITQTTEQAWNGTQVVTRTKTATFDPLGRYQIESINQLGHRVSLTVDPYRGLPLESTDENGLVTRMRYNTFGILREIEHPDGTRTFINSAKRIQQIGFSISGWFEFSTYASNAPLSTSTTDYTGQEWANNHILFDGNISGTFKYYNLENRISTYSYPYGSQDFSYDVAGRITSTTQSGNNNASLEYINNYAGLSETNINPLQQTMTHVKDVRQRLSRMVDNAGNQINYQYDTQGNLSRISAGNNEYLINYEYDLRGRMTAMTDPVLGREEYTYDGFGNLLSKTDGNGNVTSYTYDNLNRVSTMTQAEGTVTYTYDQGNKAIGKLSRITYPNYETNLVYDDVGRLAQKIINIQGNNYQYTYHYNNIGKLDRVLHPSGITLKYHYNTNFYLFKITNHQTGKLLWELKAVDLKNRVTEEELGNGTVTTYQYDLQDNLSRVRSVRNGVVIHDLQYAHNAINLKTQKIDHVNNITEDYTYDNLNRLTHVTTTGQAINEELTMTYDKWGNITSKSDLGTYHYNEDIPTLLERIDFFETDCSLPSSRFDYEYTSFNKINRITGDSVRLEITYGPDNQRLVQRMFIHNQLRETRTYVAPDYEVITINNIQTKRMSIPGSAGMAVIYEVTGTQAGKYSYLHKDDQGSVVAITNDAGVVQYRYQYDVWGKRRVTNQVENVYSGTYRGYTGHEHIVILELINMNGRIYDPVMARFLSPDPYIFETSNFQNFNRFSYVFNNPVNMTDPSGYFSLGKTLRGFVNSASKTIGRIGNGVTSIANGNIRDGLKSLGQAGIDISLKWTGYQEWDRKGKKAFGEETWNQIVVASATIVVAYGTAGLGTGASVSLGTAIMSGAAAGATGGALSAHLAGAGTNDILKSGFKGAVIGGTTAGLTHGIGTGIERAGLNGSTLGEGLRAVGHGAVQGTVTELQGGKFSSGFISGFVGSVASHTQGFYGEDPVGRVFSAAVVGGTVSSVTGGKFASGAISGAFVEMFNQMSHRQTMEQIENWHERDGGMSHRRMGTSENQSPFKGMKLLKWIPTSANPAGLLYKALQPSSLGVSTMPSPLILNTPTPTPSTPNFDYRNHLH